MNRVRRFTTLRWLVGLLTALALLFSAPATAGADSHGHGSRHEPDRIDLPNGWQPEGITTDGKYLYTGSLANGAIWRASAKTGVGRVLAPGAPGRVVAGVDYDRVRDVIWAAGAGTGNVLAFDADTGRLLRTYTFPSDEPRFLNDLVVTRDGVYVTDSFNQELAVIPFAGHHGRGHGLPAADAATTLPLTGDLVTTPGGNVFNLNGIVEFRKMLVAVQSNTGLLFAIDPSSGVTRTIDTGGASFTNGDGLELVGDILYVVRNQNNEIVPVELAKNLRSGQVVGDPITSPDLDVPTTVAFARGSLWAVNARFLPNPTPDSEYWITRLDPVH